MAQIDDQRNRWIAHREVLGLVDSRLDSFGRGGLAARTPDPGVRLLILPSDPQKDLVGFNSSFWEWWMQERDNPFPGAPRTIWGTESTPTVDAAVTLSRYSDSKWEGWEYFLALHRSGALEVVLGPLGARSWSKDEQDFRAFWLSEIVGRAWAMFSFYSEVLERYNITGPFEVTAALVNTLHAQLGNVATGWRDLDNWWPTSSPLCPEPNVLIRREVEQWPSGHEDVQGLAFSIGERVEDAWGSKDRRFLIAPKREGEGTFDPSRYRGSR
jgi:hypothetical protein